MKKTFIILILTFWITVCFGSQAAVAYNEMDFGRLFRTGSCMKCDLEGAPLSGANLTKANLSGSSLRGANLQKATLYQALLPGPRKYIGTNFSGAMWIDGSICLPGSIGTCRNKKKD